MFGRKAAPEVIDADHAQREELHRALVKLRAEVAGLREEKDRTAEVNTLNEKIEKLKLERDRLTEDQNRKVRETEHRVGLLLTQQERDVEHATREAKLAVREENLNADRERFKKDMDFMQSQLKGEVDRVDNILQSVLERLPNINATLTVAHGTS